MADGTYTWDMYVAPFPTTYPVYNDTFTLDLYEDTEHVLTLTTRIANLSEPKHEGHPGSCEAGGGRIAYVGRDFWATAAPISLLRGEKREQITDLGLNTPAGSLAFTRSYLQEQQSSAATMGLGWTHNHRMMIDDSVTNKLIVGLGSGGRAHFTYNSTLGIYEGDPGATATITVDSGSTDARYTVVTADDARYIFDNLKRLRERQWSNGETWTYSYYSSGFATEYLQEVSDDYGRKLQFTYIDDSGEFNHLQLWRVGDQTATGLDGSSPTGHFVEFTYIEEYEDGAAVTSSPHPLLSEVRDVRGEAWVYRYYGYETGEDNSDLFNRLVRFISPSVDVNGDGLADGAITRKSLTYSDRRELAINGGMELDSDWTGISDALPTTNERSTGQVDSGNYSRYVVVSAAGRGIEGVAWAWVAGRTYTITARVYRVSGSHVKMRVSGGTTAFEDTTTVGYGAWETLTVTHTPTTTSSGRRLQFVSVSGAATFYVDSVSIEEQYTDQPAQIVQELGVFGADPALLTTTYVFQPGTQTVTTETTAGRTKVHRFSGGVYVGAVDPAGHRMDEGLDEQYRPVVQVDANQQVADDGTSPVTYGYDLAGNLVNLDGTTRTYNAANQMIHDGTNTLTYDPNGNLTSDGTNTYTWDRANRLLSMGGVSYVYNGDGNRIQQNALEYILDLQPALAQVIGDSDGKRYIHAPRGIHAQHSGTDWQYPIADGLGSVRGYVAPDSTLLSSVNYSELGVPDTAWEGWAFTGEMLDASGLQYHRARYYAPNMGTWINEDFLETPNRYSYVSGNPINRVDPTGYCEWPTNWLNPIDARCRFLADGLANRFGFPVQNIIHLPYHELEALTALGSTADVSGWLGNRFKDAAIIPKLFIEDSRLTLQALQAFSCGSNNPILVGAAFGLQWGGRIGLATASSTGAVAASGGSTPWGWLVVGGTVLAVTAVLAIDATLRPSDYTWDDDDAIPVPIPWTVRPTRERQKIVLYRAIASAELEFVRGTGFRSYGFSPSAGGKYFAITEIGVRAFTNSSINVGEHSIAAITKVRISPEIAILGYYFVDVGEYGAGPAVHFSDSNLAIMYADIIASNERIIII